MKRTSVLLLAALSASLALPAAAQSRGDWTLGVGVHNVDPKSDNGTLTATPLGNLKMDIGSNARPTITGEYFIADNLGIELIAAFPFEHDVDIKGLGRVGSTKHLPPTLSVQYHFGATDAKIKPFVGAGVNYTWFFSEKTEGALDSNELRLGNSWGVAATPASISPSARRARCALTCAGSTSTARPSWTRHRLAPSMLTRWFTARPT